MLKLVKKLYVVKIKINKKVTINILMIFKLKNDKINIKFITKMKFKNTLSK